MFSGLASVPSGQAIVVMFEVVCLEVYMGGDQNEELGALVGQRIRISRTGKTWEGRLEGPADGVGINASGQPARRWTVDADDGEKPFLANDGWSVTRLS